MIEQGLKKIEIALIQQRDPHRLARQTMGCFQTRKASTDDHHMGPALHHRVAGLELKEEVFLCHRCGSADYLQGRENLANG